MKKKDLPAIIAIVLLVALWPTIDRLVFKPMFPSPPAPPPAAEASATNEVDRVADDPATGTTIGDTSAAPPRERPEPGDEPAVVAPDPPPEVDRLPERTVELANDVVRLTLSSWGGGIVSAQFADYRQDCSPDSEDIRLDFSSTPALSLARIPGFPSTPDYTVVAASDREVEFEAVSVYGLRLRRHLQLLDDYRIYITDWIENGSDKPQVLPEYHLRLGALGPVGDSPKKKPAGMPAVMGIDTLSPGGEDVRYWGKGGVFKKSPLAAKFAADREEKGLARLPQRIRLPLAAPIDWIGVKNQFFVQLLTSRDDAVFPGCVLSASRERDPREIRDPGFSPKAAIVEGVSAAVRMPERLLAVGGSVSNSMHYYVGPKKYSILKELGKGQAEVMEFGRLSAICKALLSLLNFFFQWTHNYGVAIVLLTILIRVIFWPILNKSTETTRKMQEIQPLIKELQAKYKSNPQKLQKETMTLYKEHKVNPLAGCLPLVIQIPVFFAMFTVLRAAIELRCAGFLWISDLSQPEALFAGVLPISLNILPIINAVTMVWQMRLTPSGGDPMQQKMMSTIFPVMMLVMFYNMASGLNLYWCVSQLLGIVHLLLQKRSRSKTPAKT